MSSRDFGLIQIFSTQATRDKLVFHVGSDSFNLGAGTLGSNNTITWVNSGLSWTAADTVSLSIAANTAPDAPTNLTATPGDGRLTLSWDTPADGGSAITGYEDRRSADGGTNWSPDWTALALSGAATTSFTVTGLANGTAYTFEVRAVNAVGKGTAASATATPVSPTAPLTMPPPGALVSNYAQTEDATRGTAGPTGTEQHALAQSIRLASSAQAQTLGSVVLSVAGAVPTATLTVSLHAQGSSNQPGTKLADLTGAAGVTDGNNTFTAPANTELMSDTGYWFVVQATGAQVALRTTASNSEDAGSATGWSIGDRSRKRSQDADSWSSSDSSLLLAVYGSATPAPAPTVTDVDITSTPAADDNYQTGETIQVTVTFDKAVTVGRHQRHPAHRAVDQIRTDALGRLCERLGHDGAGVRVRGGGGRRVQERRDRVRPQRPRAQRRHDPGRRGQRRRAGPRIRGFGQQPAGQLRAAGLCGGGDLDGRHAGHPHL